MNIESGPKPNQGSPAEGSLDPKEEKRLRREQASREAMNAPLPESEYLKAELKTTIDLAKAKEAEDRAKILEI